MTPEIDVCSLRGGRSLVAFDLDDTLAPEVLFITSGAYHVSGWIHSLFPVIPPQRIVNAVELAVASRLNHYSAVERLLAEYGLLGKTDMGAVVREFRHHIPDPDIYRMAPSMRKILEKIRDKDVRIAMITDGRSITQRHKIRALGLERYISREDIFISEETGHDKSHPESFMRLMAMHPEAEDFHYVGDNPPKDFLHPSRLGWHTHLADPFPLGVHCGLPR